MVLNAVCKTRPRGSIEIRQSHDAVGGVALSNFNRSERLCFTHGMKITIIKSDYDTFMAKKTPKHMFIYLSIRTRYPSSADLQHATATNRCTQ